MLSRIVRIAGPSPRFFSSLAASSDLLRSVLYVPGHKAGKAKKFDNVDGFILDLEDGVPGAENKTVAADTLRSLDLAELSKHYIAIRINSFDTPYYNDNLSLLSEIYKRDNGKFNAVVLPKVSKTADIERFRGDLTSIGIPTTIPIWAMIETGVGVVNVEKIVEKADEENVEALVVGLNDLYFDLKMRSFEREPMNYIYSRIILAAKAYRVKVLDGVYNMIPGKDVDDSLDHFIADCQASALSGFHGRTIVHPLHAEEANTAYIPTYGSVKESEDIIAAWNQQAESGKKDLIVVNGKMIEEMHVQRAKEIMSIVDLIKSREGKF